MTFRHLLYDVNLWKKKVKETGCDRVNLGHGVENNQM